MIKLTTEWQRFSDLKQDYNWLELDDMTQRGEIECRREQLYGPGGMPRGTLHWYRLKVS